MRGELLRTLIAYRIMLSADLLRQARLRRGCRSASSRDASGGRSPRSPAGRAARCVRASRRCASCFARAASISEYQLVNADDSYVEFVDRALELTPAERLDDAAPPSRRLSSSERLRGARSLSRTTRRLLSVLHRHGVVFVLVGATAAIAQGYPLPTRDTDITPHAIRGTRAPRRGSRGAEREAADAAGPGRVPDRAQVPGRRPGVDARDRRGRRSISSSSPPERAATRTYAETRSSSISASPSSSRRSAT